MTLITRSTFEMNEKNIVKLLLCNKEIASKYHLMLPNCYISKPQDNEADLFAVRKSNFCDEFEIKTSRKDFLNDRKKIISYREPEEGANIFSQGEYADWCGKGRVKGTEPWCMNKIKAYEQGLGVPNFFWYVLSDEIKFKEEEIPDYAGVIIIKGSGMMNKLRSAKRLHSNKIDDKLRENVMKKGLFRYLDGLRGWRND